jgi:asparagine N-glycosylation enzyme membrane subunit Stt3
MEVPVGVLYRWFKPAMPFHIFVVWYDCLVSSLSVFGVFFLARALWRSDKPAVFASVLYVTLYPSYGRTVKNLFLREDFAIPLILFALVFTVRALHLAIGTDRGKVRDSGAPGPEHARDHLLQTLDHDASRDSILSQYLAALFWLAALASWHLTQFVMAPFVLAAVLVYLIRGETPRVPWLVLTLAAGGLLIPVLRAKQFYLSPMMCVLYALAMAVWINGGRKRAVLVFAGWAIALLALSALLQKS